MCLSCKQKMHVHILAKNVQHWCSCTIFYNFLYLIYYILFSHFFTLPWVNFLQQNGKRQTMEFLISFKYSFTLLEFSSADSWLGEEGYPTYDLI